MRILVVDDDTLNRFLLIHMLEQQGYLDTFEAENGAEAIELVKRIKPDLILLDIVMPEVNGFEVASAVKKIAGSIYLPIIFMTAFEEEETLARCLEVGGDDFVAKPFDKVILAAKIRAHARTRLLSKKAHEQNKQLSFYRNSIEREHKIVEHIFANALSINQSYTQYLDYCLNPASDFNGDLFLANASPTGGLYFLIGDFTGHGLASAIGALPVSQTFLTMSKKGLSLMEMAETINQTLLMLLPDDMFFAAALVEINSAGNKIDVWNGGMPNLLIQNQQGQIVKRFISRHMSLGILEKHEFEAEVERYEMRKGERLIAFSDGLVEIENPENQMLGEHGVEQWLNQQPEINVEGVIKKTEEFLAGRERKDDVTMVIFNSQELGTIANTNTISKVPFKIVLDLDAEQIKSSDPIVELVKLITNHLGIYGSHSELFTVLGELYNNALEHGVLKLDSELKQSDEGFFAYFTQREKRLAELEDAQIVISTEFSPNSPMLKIQVKDSGAGFKQLQVDKLENNIEKCYGRGISLVQELCQSVQYSHNGNTVDVEFDIQSRSK
ncbi:ATP-binding SpoIIE family protein phosphatase [Paraglaciecola aestuariivivens]